MDNEKFQEMVLEQLVRITQEITELKAGQTRLENGQSKLENDLMELKNGQQVIMAQTAELTEFRAEITQKVDKLAEDVRFIKHKEHLNEEELFKLKAHLQIAK